VIVFVLAALAVLAGVPWMVVGAGVAVALVPGPATIVLVFLATVHARVQRRHNSAPTNEADLFRSLSGAVLAGSTLRNAISACRHPAVTPYARRLCGAGRSMVDVGSELSTALPVNGKRFAALCGMSEQTGASIAPTLASFAERAAETERRRRRQRASLTQARASAWVVGVAPLALTGLLVAMRGLPEPGGATVVIPMIVGAGLQVAGMAAVFAVSGRVIA
jgi:Flp pilus assembly protein TadB